MRENEISIHTPTRLSSTHTEEYNQYVEEARVPVTVTVLIYNVLLCQALATNTVPILIHPQSARQVE